MQRAPWADTFEEAWDRIKAESRRSGFDFGLAFFHFQMGLLERGPWPTGGEKKKLIAWFNELARSNKRPIVVTPAVELKSAGTVFVLFDPRTSRPRFVGLAVGIAPEEFEAKFLELWHRNRPDGMAMQKALIALRQDVPEPFGSTGADLGEWLNELYACGKTPDVVVPVMSAARTGTAT